MLSMIHILVMICGNLVWYLLSLWTHSDTTLTFQASQNWRRLRLLRLLSSLSLWYLIVCISRVSFWIQEKLYKCWIFWDFMDDCIIMDCMWTVISFELWILCGFGYGLCFFCDDMSDRTCNKSSGMKYSSQRSEYEYDSV